MEKLAGMIIKILNFFASTGKFTDVEDSATTICSIDNKKYRIEYGKNGLFKCDEYSDKMKNDLIQLADFNNLDKSIPNVLLEKVIVPVS